jgi:peptide methionine sulfoxide reductase MsrA
MVASREPAAMSAAQRHPFRSYDAEDYHQQHLDKVPNGYCPNHSTGVKLPFDFEVPPLQYVD